MIGSTTMVAVALVFGHVEPALLTSYLTMFVPTPNPVKLVEVCELGLFTVPVVVIKLQMPTPVDKVAALTLAPGVSPQIV